MKLSYSRKCQTTGEVRREGVGAMEKFFTLVEAEFSHSSQKLIRLFITVVSECLSYQRSIELQQIVQNHAI